MKRLGTHVFRCGPHQEYLLTDDDLSDGSKSRKYKKQIEPWLTAVFQSEHLSLLLGNGFTIGLSEICGGTPLDMSMRQWSQDLDEAERVDRYSRATARLYGRGDANFEDQLRAALQLYAGMRVAGDRRARKWKVELDKQLKDFLVGVLSTERSLLSAEPQKREDAEDLLVSFLLSFASRTATRERLNLFTTNYDRFIEHGCDRAGLHVIDRFVGALSPMFRATRLNIDLHYNPPGIRGEPRYLEGVTRLSKIHGSIDWCWMGRELRRVSTPFGADANHPGIPDAPVGTAMVYPNPAKEMETVNHPYAELFRDFASAICRPNSSLVTYGYGFGDEHVNRVIMDMLSIPSTHLVIIAWDKVKPDQPGNSANSTRGRIVRFCQTAGKEPQISLLLGSHFADLRTLVGSYLPKPAIDPITTRKTIIEERRGEKERPQPAPSPSGGGSEQPD